MSVFLSLGSNLGDRRASLEQALGTLNTHGMKVERVSPVVESPALLPPDAPSDWNQPFLNLVAQCSTEAQPADALVALKATERELGRKDKRHWAPRPIDIDILLWANDQISTEDLNIPHPELHRRAFVLTPLAAMHPGLRVPGFGGRSVLALSRELGQNIPLWMGIVNITPDSFSDGGEHIDWAIIEPLIDRMTESGADVLDFGAESTRPGARALGPDEELSRLRPVLERALDKYAGRHLRPLISVDTYHPEVARFAIEQGVDIINDVSGLTNPEMISLAAANSVDWIAMHQVSIPADPQKTLSTETSAVDQVKDWLEDRISVWSKAGISLDRILFDPGIGFGKTPLQSLELLREIDQFVRDDIRLLVGHSRKSFMRGIAGADMQARDMVTIGTTMHLSASGVDMLRVHNVADNVNAYRGWAHARPIR